MMVLLTPTVFPGGNILDYLKMTESHATEIPVLSGAQPSGSPTLFVPFAHFLHILLPSVGRQVKSAGSIRERERGLHLEELGKEDHSSVRQNPARSSHCLWSTNRTGSQEEGCFK